MINTSTSIRSRPSRDSCAPATRRRTLGAIAPRPTVDLGPRTVEQIAQRVAQLLRQDQLRAPAAPAPAPASLLTVKELARHLKLNPAWVYEHATELGAIRTGNGPKARMRFDLRTATEALKQHRQGTPAPSTPRPERTPARPEPYRPDAPLLEIRGREVRGLRRCFNVRRFKIGVL
jgi:hypothetical protein